MRESGYMGRIHNCLEMPNPPFLYIHILWDPLSLPSALSQRPSPIFPMTSFFFSRPPKVFAAGWISRFEQAAVLCYGTKGYFCIGRRFVLTGLRVIFA